MRCGECKSEVSEWAARCQACGAPAELAVDSGGRRWWHRQAPLIGGGVAVVLLAVAALGAWHSSDATRGAGPAAASAQSGPSAVTLIYGGGPLTFTRLGPSPGQVSYPGIVTSGYPVRPLVVGDSVVYIANGGASTIDPTRGFVHLGVATSDFLSTRPGWIWLVNRGPAALTLREVRVDGRESGPQVELPSGAFPVAAVGDGVLLRSGDDMLTVWNPTTAVTLLTLGPVAQLVAVRDPVVAFTRAGCAHGGDCDLNVVDVSSQGKTQIARPAGTSGFDGGGAVSPDGKTLALFVGSDTTSNPTTDLIIVDLRTATVSGPIPGGTIAVGEPVGSAAWSPSGRSLFFCGLQGPMLMYVPGAPAAVVLDQPSSYAFAVTESELIGPGTGAGVRRSP